MQELLQNPIAFNAVLSAAVVLGILLIVWIARRLAIRYLDSPERVFRATRSTRRVGLLLAVISLALIWSPGYGDLFQLLTIIGAGMAIALREVLLAVAGWMRVTLLREYQHGDRIEVNGVRGDVVDVRVMRTTLMEIGGWVDNDQSTGRLVHIPNNWMLEYPVYNYTGTFKFIWNELPIIVTFRSDWRAAREIMLKYANESAEIVEQQARSEIRAMSREYLIHYSILTPFVYVRIQPNGVELTLRYLCEAQKRRGSEHALNLLILDDIREHPNIEFAYNTVGLFPPEARQFGPVPGAADRSKGGMGFGGDGPGAGP
ncbi:MAG: mechanosensitive ion channel family protein [Rhodothermales bacterium]|nr:mechanosensitive ion channel family protein [Rhodothermales bacterium]